MVFKAIADTLEVPTSYRNYTDKMYNNIRQREHESTDELDNASRTLSKDVNIAQKQRNWLHRMQNYYSM